MTSDPDAILNAPYRPGQVRVRSVERVDADTILLIVEDAGRTYRTVVRKQLDPHTHYSDAAFDDLERQLRERYVPSVRRED